jgi:hypothetical protein
MSVITIIIGKEHLLMLLMQAYVLYQSDVI